MQLAAYEIDITIEQPSFGQKVGQCASREMWRHNGLSLDLVCQNYVMKS